MFNFFFFLNGFFFFQTTLNLVIFLKITYLFHEYAFTCKCMLLYVALLQKNLFIIFISIYQIIYDQLSTFSCFWQTFFFFPPEKSCSTTVMLMYFMLKSFLKEKKYIHIFLFIYFKNLGILLQNLQLLLNFCNMIVNYNKY